jgi:PAS domain S-box-containing protein
MLTGADNTSVAVEAIKCGVQDYLVKDVNLNYLQLLPTVIQRVVREREALEELNLHRSRMEDMVSKRTTKFENRSAILESANANLASKLEECTQAGIALKKHANQYVELYNNAPCCYYALDAEGVFLQINDTGIKLLGYPRDEIVGKMKITDFLSSESKDIFLNSYQQLKESGLTCNLELKITDKNGTILNVLLNSIAIKDSQSKFMMSRSIMVDISDRN